MCRRCGGCVIACSNNTNQDCIVDTVTHGHEVHVSGSMNGSTDTKLGLKLYMDDFALYSAGQQLKHPRVMLIGRTILLHQLLLTLGEIGRAHV